MAKAEKYVARIAQLYLRKQQALHTKMDAEKIVETGCIGRLDGIGCTEMEQQTSLYGQQNVSSVGSIRPGTSNAETSVTSGSTLLLGWSPKQRDVLSGVSDNTSNGRNTSIFVPGDAIVTVEIDDQTRKYLKRIGLSDDRIDDIDRMTCARVVNYLVYCFDQGDMKVIVNRRMSTPVRLLHDLPSLRGILAHQIGPIKFIGGPPEAKKRLQCGSMRTLLIDTIFVAFLKEHQKFQRFLNVRI